MKSMQKKLIIGLVLFTLVPFASWAADAMQKTDRYFYTNIIQEVTILHDVVKGYSAGPIGPDFLSNDWDSSWIGDPLAFQPGNLIGYIGLTEPQTVYLSGLTGLASGTLYFFDLMNLSMLTGTGPVTDDNAAEAGFGNYIDFESARVARVEEYVLFTLDQLDPFNIFIDHYISTYIDVDSHVYSVVGAFNDLQEPGPGPAPVPEPASILLLGSGFLGLAGLRKKLKK